MKILSIDKIREADRYTIEHEPISSADLMERAAGQVFEWLMAHIDQGCQVKIFCGGGNNGGDGLVVARRLSEVGVRNQAYQVRDFQSAADFPAIDRNDIIVDALFGSGLNRPIEGVAAELIDYLNRQLAIRVSIDIASGLFADTPSPAGAIFKPDYTLTFQQPKLAFLMPENDPYVGTDRRWKPQTDPHWRPKIAPRPDPLPKHQKPDIQLLHQFDQFDQSQ